MSLHLLGVDWVGGTAPSLDDVRAGRGVLKNGMQGAAVEYVQAIAGAVADGNFGPATEEAVKRFQNERGMTTNGIVGKDTLAAMDKLAGGATSGVQKVDFSKPDAPASNPASTPVSVPPPSSIAERATAVAQSLSGAVKSASNTPLIAGAVALGFGAAAFALLGERK